MAVDSLFALLIGTILIPQTAVIVPQFILFSRLGWVGSYLPLIVPHLFGSAFFIFLFRQWFLSLPAHVFESAELDGANPLQALRHIGLPLAWPVVAAVAVFAFIGAWNDFLGPLVYLRSPESFTLSVAMATLDGIYVQNPQNSVAIALIVLIPPIIVFLVAQRFLVRGIGARRLAGLSVVRRQHTLPLMEPTMERTFGLFGDSVIVQTNHPSIIDAAEVSFGRFEIPADADPVTVRAFVDGKLGADRAGLVHRTDGHHYLVSSPGSAAVTDLRAATATSYIDAAGLADSARLRYTYIEGPALSMLVASRGYFVLHASGVARNGVGIALHGPEGAGKTTLAVASARRGLDVFAEDGVFARAGADGLEFWGLPWVQRLVPDARELFPELSAIAAVRQPNLEMKLEVGLDHFYPGRSVPRAHPGAIVLLERNGGAGQGLVLLDDAAKEGLVEVQWPWPTAWNERHDRAAALIDELPVYRLHVNGTPDEAVDLLEELLAELAPVPLEA